MAGPYQLPLAVVAAVATMSSCAGREPVAPAREAPAACAEPSPGAPAEGQPGARAKACEETTARAPGDPDLLRLQVRRGEAEGLDYLEIVVGEVAATDPLPLVLGLHGLGDRPRIPDDARLGNDLPYRIVMPRAPKSWGPTGYTWLPVRVRDGETARLARALADRADLLARFLGTVRRRLPTVGRPIVTGGSQGGMLTFALAVKHPEAVAGALPVMGWLPPPLVPERVDDPASYPPIWAVHGMADRVIPIGPTRRSVEALRALGLDVRFEAFEGVGHHMSDPMDDQIKTWLAALLSRQLDASTDRTSSPN